MANHGQQIEDSESVGNNVPNLRELCGAFGFEGVGKQNLEENKVVSVVVHALFSEVQCKIPSAKINISSGLLRGKYLS